MATLVVTGGDVATLGVTGGDVAALGVSGLEGASCFGTSFTFIGSLGFGTGAAAGGDFDTTQELIGISVKFRIVNELPRENPR